MTAAADIGGQQGAVDAFAPDVDEFVGADGHFANPAEALRIERDADGEGLRLAFAQRLRLGRVMGGAADDLGGIAVVADAKERAIAAVIVKPERAAVLVGIAAEIAQRCVDRRLPALSGLGAGADQRAIGAQHGAMRIIEALLVAR
jgi:hypothetical protein